MPGIQILPAIETPHVSLAAERLFSIGPIPVSNSMLTMFLVMGALLLFFAYANRRLSGGNREQVLAAPRGAQNFAEFVVESLLNLVEGTAGKALGRRIFPLIASLFIFILAANYSGLLPGVGTIGLRVSHSEGEEHGAKAALVASADGGTATMAAQAAEEGGPCAFSILGAEIARANWLCAPNVPFLRAPNADLNMTIAMALLAVIIVQVSSIGAHGVGGYIKEIFTPIFLGPIHIVGEFSRIISLSARLFGNIFGGEVLLAVIIALTGPLLFGLFGLVPVIFYGLELFFGFIQALLFSLLTTIYIAVATAGHGGHDEHDDAHDHGALSPAAETGAHLG
jgi:F-type H+-transporting ATPase subunit a